MTRSSHFGGSAAERIWARLEGNFGKGEKPDSQERGSASNETGWTKDDEERPRKRREQTSKEEEAEEEDDV